MTQMESPKRKMQKKNDYQRHKLFRKIKRRRKAQAEAEQQIAVKQLRKKLKIPKFGSGKGIKSDTGAPLEVKDGMLYYKETGDPFYSYGLQLPEVEIVGDKSKINPWAAAGRHNTSSYWDANGVVHGFGKSVEAAIKYPAMIAEQNGYDTSGYYDNVNKIGKAITVLSPTRWIGTLRGTGMPWEESNQGLYGGYGETGRAADQLFDIIIGSKISEKLSDKIQSTKELLELSKENHNPFNNAFTRSVLYSYLPPASYSARKLVAPALAWPYYVLKGSAPDINKAFWTQNNFAGKALKGVFEKAYNVDGDIALQARANAYRRYLKLPQSGDYKFTQSAADGTKLTNIDALKQLKGKGYGGNARDIEVVNAGTPLVDKDFITSAGGNVSVSTKLLNKKPIEGIIKVNDTWDLMPGQRINKKISNLFNEHRTKSINKFGTRLKSKSKDFIGYRNQGLFDRMDYPDWMTISQKIKLSNIIDKGGATRTATNNSGLRGVLGRSGIKLGNYLQNFNYKNTDIYNYLNNLEVGKYIGAEPFDIQYDLPFHIQNHKINIGLGRTPTPLENKMYPQLLQFHNSGKDINIKPSKRGTFTKAAKQHGMSVQSFANKVLRNPSKYSAAMRKKANFARNASKWKH